MWELLLGVWLGGYLVSVSWILEDHYVDKIWPTVFMAAAWFVIIPLMWFNIVQEAWEGK